MTEKATTVKKVHKSDIARKIFSEHYGKKSRKDIVDLFVKEANLTIEGGRTYYQTMKKKADSAPKPTL